MMLRWISLVPAEIVYCRAASTRLNHRGASGTTSEGWFTSTCMPSSSPATSAIRTPSSEPVSFRMEPSGPGGSPRSWRVRLRSRVYLSAEQCDPLCDARAGPPPLLAVDDVMIALIHRARPEAREVRAGVGLGKALAPDLVGIEDRGKMAALLLVGAPVDDRGPHEVEAHAPGQDGRPRRGVLLLPDDPLDQPGAAAPVLLRPRDADPTGGVHRLLPRAAALERLPIGRHPVVGWIVETEVGREVRREPVAKLRVESVLDG